MHLCRFKVGKSTSFHRSILICIYIFYPGQLSATLASYQRTLDDYAVAADQEIVPERKEQAKTRIEGFRNELKDIREEFRQLKLRREENVYKSNRQELLERRHHAVQQPGGEQVPENPYAAANSAPELTRGDGLMKEQDALNRVGSQLDDFLERGKMVLGDLSEQRELLKSTRKKIYSVANTLGVSNDTIRMVERRAKQDKKIFYGGILVMLVSFYYILKWFG